MNVMVRAQNHYAPPSTFVKEDISVGKRGRVRYCHHIGALYSNFHLINAVVLPDSCQKCPTPTLSIKQSFLTPIFIL